MIVMAGTASPGGIAQVIKGYARDGIFEKWDVRWVRTHVDGSRYQRLSTACRGLGRILVWLCRGQVELVHTHAAMRGSFWRKSTLVLMCRVFRIPVILHLHGSEMKGFYSALSRSGKWWVRSTLEKADLVIVLSAGWQTYIRSIAPAANTSILPNYTPPVAQAARPEGRVPPSRKFAFLFLGALIDRKGIYELLPAFARLSRHDSDVELWLGGTGDMQRVQSLLIEYGLGNVRLLGWVDEANKNRLLRSADAFVLPSKNENLPMAVIEAMSASLPIVSTRVGGIPEMLVDGRDGLLVEPGQVDSLYQALLQIRNDPEAARRMAENALRRYEAEFSPATALPAIDAMYRELVSRPKRRSIA